ncbi:MAG: hypothetical protein ACOVRM_18235, partial [Planctomycetaceae bacterium]
ATRLSALEEARIRLAASRAEAEAVLRSAEEELARLPDDATLQTTLTGQRLEVAQRRAELAEARAAMQTLAREIELRDGRLAAIAAEIETWRRRSTEGLAKIDTLLTRLSDLKSERATLDEAPAAFAARRRALNGEIETALARRQEAADALAAAETRQRAADQAADSRTDPNLLLTGLPQPTADAGPNRPSMTICHQALTTFHSDQKTL